MFFLISMGGTLGIEVNFVLYSIHFCSCRSFVYFLGGFVHFSEAFVHFLMVMFIFQRVLYIFQGVLSI